MTIHYDPKEIADRTFCEWLTRHEQDAPVELKPDGTELTNETRIRCLAALPEFPPRGWAILLGKPELTKFARKVCVHLIAGRKTLPDQLFGKRTREIAVALQQLPPRPAAAIRT